MKSASKLLLTLVLAVQAACSKSDEPTVRGIEYSSNAAVDEFIFNNGAEPESLDPHRMSSHDAAQLAINLHEGLLTRAEDYVTISPGLAESWSVKGSGKIYEFVIRPNLKWSNGENLTTEQIRDSFIRALNPELGNTYVYWHTKYIKGAEALHKNFSSEKREAALKNYGVTIPAKNRIRIELIKPISYFKYFLSQPVFSVVHPSMYEPDSPAWTDPEKFVASSAFKLKEWSVNNRVVMEKNPNFYAADGVKLSQVVAFPVNDEATSLNMYRTGKIDWTGRNQIPTHLVSSLRPREDFKFSLGLATYMYQFNVDRKPFDDVRVRKAFALSVNQEHIAKRVMRNGAVPSNRIVPPVIEGFVSTISPQDPFKERVEEAKRLLKEAGYDENNKLPAVTIRYNTRESHHKIAQAIQQMWKKHLGANVKLENMEWKVFLKEQQAGNYDISRKGWIGDYPDPTTFLEIFQSTSENNDSGWKNEEFDRLVDKGAATLDESERYQILAKAEQILAEEVPAFGIYHYSQFSLLKPNVQGMEMNFHDHYLFRYVSKSQGKLSLRDQ